MSPLLNCNFILPVPDVLHVHGLLLIMFFFFFFFFHFRLTEEAISGNPDARTLSSISKAAFEVDDYWRIVAILHKRF